ncbi:MAG: hypothetical protein ACN6O2_01455 [Stenotrophomonas sp.]
MSNGYTAADMSTAAANGHAEGYQAGYADAVKAFDAAQPAAAQEAVACERCGRCRDGDFANCKNARSLAEASKAAIPFVAYAYSKGIDGAESAGRAIESALVASVDAATAWADGYASGVIDERTSDDNIGIAGFGAKIDPARANPYLLAAPVAAAPVCADCSTPLLYECIGCSATNYPASTPAAPGIDLAILRELADDWSSEAVSSNGSERDALRSCAKELRGALGLIDASPKGGSELPVEPKIWGTQKPGSMPKLFGAHHIAELNWYPDEGHDLVCMQVIERVQATSAEVGK